MKQFLTILSFLLAAACGRVDSSDPRAVSEAFLEAYFAHDFERAAGFAGESTLEEIRFIQAQWAAEGITQEEAMREAQRVLIEIDGVRVTGDTAICTYTIRRSPTDANAMEENLLLVKKNNDWKVEF